mmetsp:Transcript_66501/g.138883  ORF Transcript_66501/g.138883 Transcript_66501/m.138883 type:complete len:265 (-) Transcript_66501:222-1016(-)
MANFKQASISSRPRERPVPGKHASSHVCLSSVRSRAFRLSNCSTACMTSSGFSTRNDWKPCSSQALSRRCTRRSLIKVCCDFTSPASCPSRCSADNSSLWSFPSSPCSVEVSSVGVSSGTPHLRHSACRCSNGRASQSGSSFARSMRSLLARLSSGKPRLEYHAFKSASGKWWICSCCSMTLRIRSGSRISEARSPLASQIRNFSSMTSLLTRLAEEEPLLSSLPKSRSRKKTPLDEHSARSSFGSMDVHTVTCSKSLRLSSAD